MATLDITITNGCARPDPATISQTDANGYDKVKFKTHDRDVTYTLGGLDKFLSGASKSESLSRGHDVGPFSAIDGSTYQGNHGYTVSPACPTAADPEITVDA
jgi:hypothetical protein